MDFFKSVFADDPPPSDSDESQREDQHELVEEEEEEGSGPEPNPDNPNSTDSNTAWSFGGLIKTLATKSESVIQNYRRDLEDFRTELKKETSAIREVASRAVKDLPASLEVGASVAQESLESVGQAIDDIGSTVWKSTAGIIAHGRETLLAADLDSDHSDINNSYNKQLSSSSSRSLDFKPYSRFEAQVRAIQSNKSTYLEEPDDLDNYKEWKSGFALDEKKEVIEKLMAENEMIGEMYGNLVPDKTEHESFWYRYLYRVHRLKEVEDARAKLVKRAISGEDEDLSWDVGDEEDKEEEEDKGSGSASMVNSSGNAELEKKQSDSESVGTRESVSDSENRDNKFDEKEATEEGKAESRDSSCKDSDVSIVSRPEEEDLGWDEIEDIGSSDESKGGVDAAVGSTNRADLRKRLSAAEEDEDLSWDIEDDANDDNGKDGTVKA